MTELGLVQFGFERTMVTSPASVLGEAAQNAKMPCCRAKATMLMASTVVRGNGNPREPGSGYRS